MNELQIFKHPIFGEIRFVEHDGKPYAVGLDVAKMLEYANPSKAVIDHCKGVSKLGIPSAGGIQETNCIPEGDIYRLIVKAADQSKNPAIRDKASEIEHWIFDDVVPTIMRHGMYAVDQLLEDPDLAIKAFTALKEEREKNKRLAAENLVLEQRVSEYEPKIQYVDKILRSPGTLTIKQIAADYGLTAQALNQILHEERIQYTVNGQWILYREYLGLGYTKSDPVPIVRSDGRSDYKLHTKWTQKGRYLIHDILTKRGIMANMDKEATQTRLEDKIS